MLAKSFVPMSRVTYYIPPTQTVQKWGGDLEKETKQNKNEGEWTVKIEIRTNKKREKNHGSG